MKFQELSSSWGPCRRSNARLSPGPKPGSSLGFGMILLEEFGDLSELPYACCCLLLLFQGRVFLLLLKQGAAGNPVSREDVTALSMVLLTVWYLGISEGFW